MKRRRILQSMLATDGKEVSAVLSSDSNVDYESGVLSLSLDGTVGGLRPLLLRVGGAPVGYEVPTLDAPLAPILLGEHAVDRIGVGFLSFIAQNPVTLTPDTEGLAWSDGATLALDLGAPFDGSVTLSVGGESESKAISGEIGNRVTFHLPRALALLGEVTLTASADGVFRPSLYGDADEGAGCAITLLACGKDGKELSASRILLSTPMYTVPSGATDILSFPEQRRYRAVGCAEADFDTPLALYGDSAEAYAPAFALSLFGTARGEGEARASHGTVLLDDPDVRLGDSEGLSLLSDDGDKLVLALSYERLTDGVLSLDGIRLDNYGTPTPSVYSPAEYDFYPFGDYEHYVESPDREMLAVRLPEPLRCVGPYADRLYFDLQGGVALCERRIGVFALTGDEEMVFIQNEDSAVVFIPFSGGQLASEKQDVPQLCTHGTISSSIVFGMPEMAGDFACYLDRDELAIALGVGYPFAESETAFRTFLRTSASQGQPLTVYYPLAEARYERLALSVFGGDPSYYEEDDYAVLYPSPITSRESSSLEVLARLWLGRQSPRLSVLYPLGEPYYEAAAADAPLRLPDGKTTLTVAGEVKPLQLVLSACVYGATAKAAPPRAAGGESYENAPQKGTE